LQSITELGHSRRFSCHQYVKYLLLSRIESHMGLVLISSFVRMVTIIYRFHLLVNGLFFDEISFHFTFKTQKSAALQIQNTKT